LGCKEASIVVQRGFNTVLESAEKRLQQPVGIEEGAATGVHTGAGGVFL